MIKIIVASIFFFCHYCSLGQKSKAISVFIAPGIQQKMKFTNDQLSKKYITPKNSLSFEAGAGFSIFLSRNWQGFSSISIGMITNSLGYTSLKDSISSFSNISTDEISSCINLKIGAKLTLIDRKNKLFGVCAIGFRKIFETSAGGYSFIEFMANQNEVVSYNELPYYRGNYNTPIVYYPKILPLIDLGLSYNIKLLKHLDLSISPIYNYCCPR